MNQQLVIVRGLPGSGKSTLAKKEFPSHIHVESDMYFMDEGGNYNFDFTKLNAAHKWCQRKVRKLLESGNDVIVTNTFTMDWEFDPYIEMVNDIPVDLLVVEMKTQYQNVHGVPEDKMEVMRKRWQSWDHIDNHFALTAHGAQHQEVI